LDLSQGFVQQQFSFCFRFSVSYCSWTYGDGYLGTEWTGGDWRCGGKWCEDGNAWAWCPRWLPPTVVLALGSLATCQGNLSGIMVVEDACIAFHLQLSLPTSKFIQSLTSNLQHSSTPLASVDVLDHVQHVKHVPGSTTAHASHKRGDPRTSPQPSDHTTPTVATLHVDRTQRPNHHRHTPLALSRVSVSRCLEKASQLPTSFR